MATGGKGPCTTTECRAAGAREDHRLLQHLELIGREEISTDDFVRPLLGCPLKLIASISPEHLFAIRFFGF